MLDESLVKSLHFMMLKYDLTKNPGQWRPGAVWVENQDGEVVYEAPPRDELEGLVSEVLATVNEGAGDPLVRAAMAHLNLALVHPFSDGNKRIGTLLFLDYLRRNGLLLRADGEPRLADNAMVALALLVAESEPAQKELMIRLVLNLLEDGS